MTASPVLDVVGATSRAADGTILLDDVTFAVEAGWLVAVVGPTGAGKTSLAKAVLGQLPLSSGSVTVAGRGRVAGVPQDDATHPQLSLRRTLDHAAALRGDATTAERRARVQAVLDELGLAGRAGTRLADLSGGERKRANVAVELLGRPDLLVLDEPTAGLDPAFEKSVFASLRSRADRGRTIVAITHSVRVLDVCDRVLFLAPGGTVAFFGTPADAKAYFDWSDPADAYAALSTGSAAWKDRFASHQARADAPAARPAAAPAWTPRWGSSPVGATATASTAASDEPSRSGHLRTVLHRAVQLATSDRRTLCLTLAAGPVLGLLLWAVLPGSTLRPPSGPEGAAPKAATFAFFLAMTITWLGAASAAREVVKERHILRRELGAGMSLPTYVTGKALFLSGLTALQVLPLVAIAVLNQQAPGSGPALGSGLLEVMVVALLVGVAAVATGLVVSAWASSSEKAMTALPVVLIAQLALAGPWAEDRGVAVDVLRHLIPAKLAGDAVAATVVGDASGWWLGVLGLLGIATVQLAGALALLHRSAPSRSTEVGDDRLPVGTRLATTRPPGIRLVPAALALVIALAAGAGALGRAGDTAGPEDQAAAAVPPTTSAPAPAPPAAPPTTAAAIPAPATPPTTAAAMPTTLPPPPATTVRRTAPAPTPTTTPPTTRPPATTPTTAPPTTPTTRAPAPAATNNPLAFQAWLLQQIFNPPRR